MNDTVWRIEIRGRVQGVGYRGSMIEQARRLQLRGWVRNRRDGSVEALVHGPQAAIDQIVAWARVGPRWASVASVEVLEADGSGAFDSFEQMPTE